MKKIAFLFPGQGAQVVGMGADFYQQFPVAKKLFEQANEILGRDLTKIIFEGPEEVLVETENCQTAIFVTSMAILEVIKEQFPQLKPSICAGLSLGEYSAVCASGRMSFADALSLVQVRSQGMQLACETTKGTMAAIFGPTAEEIDAIVAKVALPGELWVANYNCPGQTVVSGTQRGVEAAMQAAKSAGAKRAIPLKVHGAFHSGLMQSATDKLARKIYEVPFISSEIDIVMNVVGGFVYEEQEMRRNLIDQVTHAVRWQQGIEAMAPKVSHFIEIGSGTTLTGMNRKMNVEAATIAINKVEDVDLIKGIFE